MRKLSRQRRMLVVQAGAMAAMNGAGPILLRGHKWAICVWCALMVVMAVRLIMLMVRVRRTEGCAC